ncbi:hypothetical protein D3C85_1280740 [compost metagenome]
MIQIAPAQAGHGAGDDPHRLADAANNHDGHRQREQGDQGPADQGQPFAPFQATLGGLDPLGLQLALLAEEVLRSQKDGAHGVEAAPADDGGLGLVKTPLSRQFQRLAHQFGPF